MNKKTGSYEEGIKVNKEIFIKLPAEKRAGVLFDCVQSLLWHIQKQWYLLIVMMLLIAFKDQIPVELVKKALAAYF